MINRKIPQLFEVKESLGPLESKVMRIIWGKDKTDVREVTEVIRKKKPIAYTTIMTIMDTLFKKGFLTRQKVGKAYQYKTIAPKTVFLKNAFSLVIDDLIKNYGRAKVILAALPFNTSFVKQVKQVKQLKTPTISVSRISQHKTSIGYGMTLAFLATILLYSVWDLSQNLEFFGTIEYINLAFSEPTIVTERLNLITLAVVESLPILNISATIIFFILFVFVVKRLNKITGRNISPKLGGLV